MGIVRTSFGVLVAALVAASAGIAPSSAQAEKRVALIVGNSAYKHVNRLENPANDARLMAETLRTLGFTLVGNGPQLDLDETAFKRAVQNFGDALPGADVALFYYAGHGVQVRGSNFLVPVGANPVKEADVDFQMLDTNLVLRQMDSAGARLNLVILDACRNNPFGGRGLRSTGSGLAQMQAPQGTLISFATQPGNVALDGTGRNSPYTTALAAAIRKPGLDIFRTFNEVGLAVSSATNGAQQPWVSLSPIKGDFYFGGAPVASGPGPAAPPAQDPAERTWAVMQNTTSVAVLEDFVRQFGTTPFGSMARARIDELKKSQVAVVAPPVVPAVPPQAAPKPAVGLSTEPAPGVTPLAAARERALKPKDTFKECEQCPDMVVVPAGSFTMGSSQNEPQRSDNESPQHKVTFARAFAVGRYAVSFAEWDACVADGGCNGHKPGDEGWGRDKRPVINVSWTDAQAYVAWLSKKTGKRYRLLSEAERENVARAGTTTPYWWGQTINTTQAQYDGEFSGIGSEITMEDGLLRVVGVLADMPAARARLLANDVITHVDGEEVQGLTLIQGVGKLRGRTGTAVVLKVTRSGVSPFDMTVVRGGVRFTKTLNVDSGAAANPWELWQVHGNVWELTEDCYHDRYRGAPADGSAWTESACPRHVRRGGSWSSNASELRAAARNSQASEERNSSTGFRVARSLTR